MEQGILACDLTIVLVQKVLITLLQGLHLEHLFNNAIVSSNFVQIVSYCLISAPRLQIYFPDQPEQLIKGSQSWSAKKV